MCAELPAPEQSAEQRFRKKNRQEYAGQDGHEVKRSFHADSVAGHAHQQDGDARAGDAGTGKIDVEKGGIQFRQTVAA